MRNFLSGFAIAMGIVLALYLYNQHQKVDRMDQILGEVVRVIQGATRPTPTVAEKPALPPTTQKKP